MSGSSMVIQVPRMNSLNHWSCSFGTKRAGVPVANKYRMAPSAQQSFANASHAEPRHISGDMYIRLPGRGWRGSNPLQTNVRGAQNVDGVDDDDDELDDEKDPA